MGQMSPKISTGNDRTINEGIYEALNKKVPEGAQARDLLVQSLQHRLNAIKLEGSLVRLGTLASKL